MVEPVEQPSEERQVLAGLAGTVLGERYQLERMLGAGGMGAVFEGRDLRLGRAVAVKVMQPGYARDAEYVKRFLREAQAASMIRHRNVVVVLDYGEVRAGGEAAGGIVYSVMERLVGQDLEESLRAQPGQRMAWSQACGLLVQIASGLRAAHAQGVIHRDVKPANCFLTTEDDEPVVKVVDFGIAKLGEGLQTQQLTGTGNVLGTPSYTAPEMVLTGGPASPRSDVYSLGVVAYRMLMGRLPFTGTTAFEVMHHACILPVPGMREGGVDVPESVEALVLEMLSKKPEQRPADMRVVRQRLVALGREAGGVPAAVEGVASSSLRIEVGAATSGAGKVTRTEELESGPTTPVPRLEPKVADAAAVERTDVMIGAGFREPTARPLATPIIGGAVASTTVERTEVLDSGRVERPRHEGVGWIVGVGVLVVVVSAGVAWGVLANGEPAAEASTSREAVGGAVAVAEPPTRPVEPRPSQEPAQPTEEAKPVVPTPRVDEDVGESSGDAPVVIDELDGDAKVVDPPVVVEPPKPPGKSDGPRVPAGPASDAALKKKLASKIKKKCAVDLGGEGVTVFVTITPTGAIKRLTAMPKGPAEACAKQQITGTVFRSRPSENSIEIEVSR